MNIELRKEFMLAAIKEAQQARIAGDYAIGAVIVKENQIIARATNRSRRDESPIAHAETLAIIEVSKMMHSRHLEGCILYTTHEPCPMCASLSVFARLAGIVYGARISDMNEFRIANSSNQFYWTTIGVSCKEIVAKSNIPVEVIGDFLRDECLELFHV